MAYGDLTWEEFCKLSKEDRLERCGELSAHDAYRLRMTEPIAVVLPPCNECVYRDKGKPSCKAFPKGIDSNHLRALMNTPTIECGDGYRFKKGLEDAN